MVVHYYHLTCTPLNADASSTKKQAEFHAQLATNLIGACIERIPGSDAAATIRYFIASYSEPRHVNALAKNARKQGIEMKVEQLTADHQLVSSPRPIIPFYEQWGI